MSTTLRNQTPDLELYPVSDCRLSDSQWESEGVSSLSEVLLLSLQDERPFLLLNKIDVCCCSAFSSFVQLALEDPSFVQPRAGAWVIKSDYDSVNSEYDLIHSKNTCEACQNSERWWRYLHLSNLDDFRVFQSGKTMLINLLSLLYHISRVSHMFTESCDRSWSFSFSHSQWPAPGNNCHVSCPCSCVGLATSPGPLLNK